MSGQVNTQGKSYGYLLALAAYIGIITLILLYGCSAPRTQESITIGYYRTTSKVMSDNIPKSVLEACGYKIQPAEQVQIPQTIGVEQIKPDSDGRRITGQFWPTNPPRVLYVIGKEHGLIHEYQHYFNSIVSTECIDEIAAYYAEAIAARDEKVKELQRIIFDRNREIHTLNHVMGNYGGSNRSAR